MQALMMGPNMQAMMNTNMGNMNNFQMQPTMTGPVGGTSIASLRPDISHHLDPSSAESDNNSTIRRLATDINQGLDDFRPSRSSKYTDSEIDDESDTEEIIEPKRKQKRNIIPEFLKEPMLLLSVYLILSLGFVKRTIGTYISYINPTDDGNVSFLGIIIYGSILTVSYTILKHLFL